MCLAMDNTMYGTFRLYENTQDNTRKIGEHGGNKERYTRKHFLSLVCFLLLKNHLYFIMYVDIHISEDNFWSCFSSSTFTLASGIELR